MRPREKTVQLRVTWGILTRDTVHAPGCLILRPRPRSRSVLVPLGLRQRRPDVRAQTLGSKGRGRPLCWWTLAPKGQVELLPMESDPNPHLRGRGAGSAQPSLAHGSRRGREGTLGGRQPGQPTPGPGSKAVTRSLLSTGKGHSPCQPPGSPVCPVVTGSVLGCHVPLVAVAYST